MALPLILGMLGSGLAGSGALAGLGILGSPLIAGAIGSGLGSAIETGDLKEGIKTGLMSGLLGGIGGALVGGGAGAGASTAAQGATQTVPNAATGLRGMMQNMPRGFDAVPAPAGGFAFNTDALTRGVNQGILSGAGVGTAIPGLVQAMQPEILPLPEREYIPEARPADRERRRPPAGYRPGYDPEFEYFGPLLYRAGGGMVRYTPAGMSEPMRMQAGGIADMMPGAEMEMPEMNDKALVQEAIRAIRGEIPEEAAAIVLGQFLQQFGEQALRQLVDDVQSGQSNGDRGKVEGTVEGPGDGMDDMVPATMDDGSQDVLLSDGEFIVPADVVSGLGNGSTDAGADELYKMMDRVREERTGTTKQAKQVNVGGLLPA